MGRYNNSSQNRSSASTPKIPHEIWRGIGCLMILIIPAISIAAGYETIKFGLDNKWPIPYELLKPVRLSDIFYSTPGLRTVFGPLSSIPNFWANAAVSIIYMVLLSGLISMIYAFVYRAVGPSRYGPTDAPPTGARSTKKSR